MVKVRIQLHKGANGFSLSGDQGQIYISMLMSMFCRMEWSLYANYELWAYDNNSTSIFHAFVFAVLYIIIIVISEANLEDQVTYCSFFCSRLKFHACFEIVAVGTSL